MGAGDWMSGGLRRVVSGVRSAVPGQGEREPGDQQGVVLSVAAPAEESVQAAPVRQAPEVASLPQAAPVGAPERQAVPENPEPTKRAQVKREPTKRAPVKRAPAKKPPTGSEVTAVTNWTDDQLAEFRSALTSDITRLREELNMGAADMADLLADSSDGAGDDQADAGSKTLEREQEMSVNANARDLLEQSAHALRRLEAGTYGICESCGNLIPAARLRAFPRATLDIACKQADERR